MSARSNDSRPRRSWGRPNRTGVCAWILFASLWIASSRTFADGPQTSVIRPPAVWVSYLNENGFVLRVSGGTLSRQGLVVPYSSLLDANSLSVKGHDDKSWTADHVLAIHPEADLALLQIADIPAYAVEVPGEVHFARDEDIWITERLGGRNPEALRAHVHGKFSLRGPDFLALSKGAEPGSPAFTDDATFLGVCLEVATDTGDLPYLATAASLRNLIAGRSKPVLLDSLATPLGPSYTSRFEIDGFVFRGALLAVRGENERARTFLDRALFLDPFDSDAHYWSGQILFAEGRHETAAEEFLAATRADSSFSDAWHMAGAAYQRVGLLDRAVEMYALALDVDPTAALTYCNLGSIYYHRLQTSAARAAFERAARLDPTQGLAYYNLALLANEEGRTTEAESILIELERRDDEWADRLRKALHKD